MARVRDLQGVSTHLETLKSDGKRRHPARCKFAYGKASNRECTNTKSAMYNKHCSSAKRCDLYEEKGEQYE